MKVEPWPEKFTRPKCDNCRRLLARVHIILPAGRPTRGGRYHGHANVAFCLRCAERLARKIEELDA